MCFYHSVAIKIEIDHLLEVTGLKQTAKIFPFEGCEQEPFVLKSACACM